MSQDIDTIMAEYTPEVTQAFPENSFEILFWEQQQKALNCKDSKQMRWRPLMIKWCLYLRHLSRKAYETISLSGCIRLPSQRTLRDYTHHIKLCVGFSTAVDRELIRAAELQHCPDFKKNVALIMDEMYVKEDLVYDKTSGELIGFTDVGDINTHLLEFQAQVEVGSEPHGLAKSVLVFMVRGLFSSLEFPYAQFPLATTTGDLMFSLLWEAISRLELCGAKVQAVTADGASPNRRLFKIHTPFRSSVIKHKVKNPCAHDGRDLYFISDPPHLLKTIRNCMASRARRLWVSSS